MQNKSKYETNILKLNFSMYTRIILLYYIIIMLYFIIISYHKEGLLV